MTQSSHHHHLRKIIVCAVLLGAALITKSLFSISIPIFGQNGMRVGIAGVFSVMPSILFGPLYGGLVSGLSDLLGYLLKPSGPYMPLMTLTAFLGGFLRGGLWLVLRRVTDRTLRIVVLALMIAAGVLGALHTAALASDGIDASYYDRAGEAPSTQGMQAISRLLIERTQSTKDPSGNLATYLTYMTTGLFGLAILGVLICAADLVLSKRFLKDQRSTGTMGILLSMIVSGLIVTTLNTVILRNMLYESWRLLPFIVVWLPRAIEEVVVNTVMAYFVVTLYGIFIRRLERQQGSLPPRRNSLS